MMVWDQIKQELAKKLSSESYQNWLASTQQHADHGGRLTIRVPSEATKMWMEQEYSEHVAAAVATLQLGMRQVHYEVVSSQVSVVHVS